jgi:dihydroxyacid dehydratase/phosphogluconate dehydratase
MDARTNIETRQLSRHMTAGPSRAQASPIDLTEIFKKTPDIPDLKPSGRYLAADLRQVADIPLLMKTLLDHGHGDCITVPGRTIAEDLKSVTGNPRQDVARAPAGAVFEVADMSRLKFTGPAGCFDSEERTAVVGPIALLQDGDITGIVADDVDAPDLVAPGLNVKLTGAALTKRRTKWKVRETHHRSGALWKYAQQVGPALGGAVTHPGGAHEKQCYADS